MHTDSTCLAEVCEEYMRLVEELSKRSNGTSKVRVEAILSSTMCERFASCMISEGKRSSDSPRFDPYYREKHELAKRKFVDRIKSKLSELGKETQFLLQTEGASDFGRYDLIIIGGNSIKIQARDRRSIHVEFKSSRGLDLSQIERYLLSNETLVLVRVITGQVVALSPNKLSGYLREAIRDLSSKTERLIEGRLFLVPGFECYKCPIKECVHNKFRESKPLRLITMNQKEFEKDLEEFMQKLYPTIDKAIQVVFEELEIDKDLSN